MRVSLGALIQTEEWRLVSEAAISFAPTGGNPIAEIVLHRRQRFASHIESEYTVDSAARWMRIEAVSIQAKTKLGWLETALRVINPGIFLEINGSNVKGAMQLLKRALFLRRVCVDSRRETRKQVSSGFGISHGILTSVACDDRDYGVNLKPADRKQSFMRIGVHPVTHESGFLESWRL
jgi:hypothetical protein